MNCRRSCLWLVLCPLFLSSAALADDLFNDEGYRIQQYRRATPATAPAGRRIDAVQLQRLLQDTSLILIDVQAITVRPETADFGFAWLPSSQRMHIAGSTWLPNVGYGELEPRMRDYFRSSLARLTNDDRGQAIVFYCVVDCWMSWNAVKRAASWGYANLYWFAEGTDGWQEAGLPLVPADPLPLLPGAPTFFTRLSEAGLPEVANMARAGNRDILLFFETPHCPFCKRMRASVLNDDAVIARVRDHFIAIAIDLESGSRLLDQHQHDSTMRDFARDNYRIVRTPTLVFVDADFNLLHKHSGLIATPGEIIRLFDFVATRSYESQAWKDYQRVNDL